MKKKTLYSGFRFDHHNEGAGYDLIVPNIKDYVCGNNLPFSNAHIESKWRKLNFIIIDLLTLIRGIRYDAVHYFYPENTAIISPIILKLLGKKIVYTVHLQEDFWIKKSLSILHRQIQKSFNSVDLIITLSKNQKSFFEKKMNKKSFFLPHGLTFSESLIDDNYISLRKKNRKVVIVGHNYRDFDMLETIVKKAEECSEQITFHLIGSRLDKSSSLSGYQSVIIYDKLSVEDYNSVLKEAYAMLLPLTFATANNALLEAYNYGIPVFCNDIEGIRDYSLNTNSLFTGEQDFWNKFNQLNNFSEQQYIDLAHTIYETGKERYDWGELADELNSLYH